MKDYIGAQQKLTAHKLRKMRNKLGDANKDRLRAAFDMLEPYTNKDWPLLDVGSREGWWLWHLMYHGYKDVQGVDVSPDAVSLMKSQGLKVQQADAHNLSTFYKGQFNTITLIHVLEHCPQPKRVVDELHRVLSPDGVLYIEVPLEEIPNKEEAHFICFHKGQDLLDLFVDQFEVLKCEPDPNTVAYGSNFKCVLKRM